MVQNIPGMLRVLSEAREMQRRGERLDVNVMVRLGAWTPITESTWESKAGLCREGTLKDAVADVNVGQNKLTLSDWRISAMTRYCNEHGGAIPGGVCTQNYGYIIETENYRYALRCNPQQGDYNVYLTAFDKRVQEMNMQQAQENEMTMGGM